MQGAAINLLLGLPIFATASHEPFNPDSNLMYDSRKRLHNRRTSRSPDHRRASRSPEARRPKATRGEGCMRISSDIIPQTHAILQPTARPSVSTSHRGTIDLNQHVPRHQPSSAAHYPTHPDAERFPETAQLTNPNLSNYAQAPPRPVPLRAAPLGQAAAAAADAAMPPLPPPAQPATCPPAAPTRARDAAAPAAALESWPGAHRGAAARAAAARTAAARAAAARAAAAAAVEDLSLGPGEPTRPGALDAEPGGAGRGAGPAV
jgi:hypothetical protein